MQANVKNLLLSHNITAPNSGPANGEPDKDQLFNEKQKEVNKQNEN